jgi:nicotinate-nucleotide adenylyltransferase
MTAPVQKTILFGGSFDPPHIAHMQMIDLAYKAIGATNIIVLPALQAASVNAKEKPSASFEQRKDMIYYAIEDYRFKFIKDNSRIKVSSIEESLPIPNYSINTVEQFHSQNPEIQYYFLMGQDQIRSFDAWKEPSKMLSMVNLIAIKRQGPFEELEQSVENMLTRLKENTIRKVSDQTTSYETQFNTSIILVDIELSEAQSTLIRDKGQSFRKEWLSQNVTNYIEKNKLYTQQTKKTGDHI